MDLFERVAEVGGQLLRVDRAEPAGIGGSGLLLTFDVGRLLVRADPVERHLVVEVAESREDLPGELLPANEEEPWWRVLGSPLVRVTPLSEGTPLTQGLRLQFRADDDAPRIIALSSRGPGVSAALL
jgi:hypothetical protein